MKDKITKIRDAVVLSIIFNLLFLIFHADARASVVITKTSLTDSLGSSRSMFSSTEKINLRIETYCSASVLPDRIYYKFLIMDPSGRQVFSHEGNSTQGNVGRGASTLKNVPLSFYSSPGMYRFKAEVLVAGAVAATDESRTFTIFSPVITLTYPPDSATDLIDKPLTFRWVASGASKYKVYVDDDRSFYTPLWTGETSVTYMQYPLNPSDERQKLSGGVQYYWKVEGLSSDGSVAAKSDATYSFTLKEETVVSSFRNIAVKDVTYSMASTPPQNVQIDVSLENTGNQSETNIKLQLFIDGAVADARDVSSMMPGEKKKITFTLENIMKEGVIATAMIATSDDNAKDNIMTRTLEIPLPEEWRNVPKILGRVVEKTTKNGIPGIAVSLEGPVSRGVKTGAGGQFKFEKLEQGHYTVKVPDSEDFTGSEITVDVQQEKAYPGSVIELAAVAPQAAAEENTVTIKGRITDDTSGYALAGAAVKLFVKAPADKDFKETAGVVSGAKGYYKFGNAPVGDYELEFAKEGYETLKHTGSTGAKKTVIADVKLKMSVSAASPAAKNAPEFSPEEAWNVIKDKIKDKKVLEALKDYKPYEVKVSDGDTNEAVAEIRDGKLKIKKAVVEMIK